MSKVLSFTQAATKVKSIGNGQERLQRFIGGEFKLPNMNDVYSAIQNGRRNASDPKAFSEWANATMKAGHQSTAAMVADKAKSLIRLCITESDRDNLKLALKRYEAALNDALVEYIKVQTVAFGAKPVAKKKAKTEKVEA